MKYPGYSEMKDSGIEWLGEIPEHWKIDRLKYISKIRSSNVDKKSKEGEISVQLCNYTDVYYNEQITSEIDFMKATASSDKVKKFELCMGDVIITKDSEDRSDIAVPAYVSENFSKVVCGYHLALIRPIANKIYGKYLFRAFQSTQINEQFQILANGITRYGLSINSISSSIFITPPINEQKVITNFLDQETGRIDQLINKKEQLIELLEEKRQTLISHAVTKGLNSDVSMKDSGIEWLGEIPEHWEVTKLKYLTKKIVDGTHHTPKYTDEGITFLRVTDISSSKTIKMDEVKYISEKEHNELKKRCNPECGDLLLSKNGTIGIPRVIDWKFDFSIFVSLCLIKFNSNYNVYFASYFFKSYNIKAEICFGSKTNTVTNLHLDQINEFYFPMLSYEEQQQIVEHLDIQINKIDNLTNKIKQQISNLKEYRQALISNAITGKIDVREVYQDE